MINESMYQMKYVPVAAWMVYQRQYISEEKPSYIWGDRRMPEFYLEEHELFPAENGTHQLGAASPLTQEKIQAVSELVADKKLVQRHFKGIVPTSVLSIHTTPEVLIWKVKATSRTIHFDIKGMGKAEVYCPHLIFSVTDNHQLKVYATKTYNVKENTPLYQAPFPNIHQGRVCIGSAHKWIKKPTAYEELMKQWEEIFFDSSFNSDNDKGRAKVSLPELWNPLMSTNQPFPTNKLIKTNLTLNDLLR